MNTDRQELSELLGILREKPDLSGPLLKVAKGILGTEYGDVIAKMQGGKVIWVDVNKRERVG